VKENSQVRGGPNNTALAANMTALPLRDLGTGHHRSRLRQKHEVLLENAALRRRRHARGTEDAQTKVAGIPSSLRFTPQERCEGKENEKPKCDVSKAYSPSCFRLTLVHWWHNARSR